MGPRRGRGCDQGDAGRGDDDCDTSHECSPRSWCRARVVHRSFEPAKKFPNAYTSIRVRAAGAGATARTRRHEQVQERRADQLQQVRGLGERDRTAVDDVDDRGQEQPGGQRGREGQESHRAKWSPGREDEADRERKIPRPDLVRDVDGRALVGAVDQARHGERELRRAPPRPVRAAAPRSTDRRGAVAHGRFWSTSSARSAGVGTAPGCVSVVTSCAASRKCRQSCTVAHVRRSVPHRR